MSQININCIDQSLFCENRPPIASGGVKETSVKFTFCERWDGFEKTAVFYRDKDDVYTVMLNANDMCLIPKEVIAEHGFIHIGVYGIKDDCRRTSNILSYKLREGAFFNKSTMVDPGDPDDTPVDDGLFLVAENGDMVQLVRVI